MRILTDDAVTVQSANVEGVRITGGSAACVETPKGMLRALTPKVT